MLSHDPREDIIRSTSPDDSELPTKGWLGAVLAVAGRVFNCWGFGLGILMDAIYQSVRASVGYFVPLPAMV